jgi:hypothetical protein
LLYYGFFKGMGLTLKVSVIDYLNDGLLNSFRFVRFFLDNFVIVVPMTDFIDGVSLLMV